MSRPALCAVLACSGFLATPGLAQAQSPSPAAIKPVVPVQAPATALPGVTVTPQAPTLPTHACTDQSGKIMDRDCFIQYLAYQRYYHHDAYAKALDRKCTRYMSAVTNAGLLNMLATASSNPASASNVIYPDSTETILCDYFRKNP